MRNRYTAKQRRDLLQLVTTGRATVAEAAARLGVKRTTAYLWARGEASAGRRGRTPEVPPTFARLVPSGDMGGSLALRIGAVEIEVRRNFDRELLRAVVEAVRGDGGGA